MLRSFQQSKRNFVSEEQWREIGRGKKGKKGLTEHLVLLSSESFNAGEEERDAVEIKVANNL